MYVRWRRYHLGLAASLVHMLNEPSVLLSEKEIEIIITDNINIYNSEYNMVKYTVHFGTPLV